MTKQEKVRRWAKRHPEEAKSLSGREIASRLGGMSSATVSLVLKRSRARSSRNITVRSAGSDPIVRLAMQFEEMGIIELHWKNRTLHIVRKETREVTLG